MILEAPGTDRLISVVEDDASIRSATVDLLASLGFACEAFASAEAYLRSDVANRTVCLILDVRMPGLNGLELQRHLTDQGRIVPIIFITAFPDERSRRQAIAGGAICYLPKPYEVEELLDSVRLALEGSRPDETLTHIEPRGDCADESPTHTRFNDGGDHVVDR